MLSLNKIDLLGFEEYLRNNNKAEGTIKVYLYEMKKLQSTRQISSYLAEYKEKPLLIFSWRSYLKYLRDIGRISGEELYLQLERYKPPPKRGKVQKHTWYLENEWTSIIEKMPHRIGKMCAFMQLNFGLRIGELVHLRKNKDIDREKRLIHVQKRLGWKPKHARERSIPCKKSQLRIIDRWIRNIPGHITHDYLLFNTRGNKLIERTVQKWYSKVGIQSHDLRRSFAKVYYYKSSKDVKFVSNLLGHANISTTSEYLGLDLEEMQQKYDRL